MGTEGSERMGLQGRGGGQAGCGLGCKLENMGKGAKLTFNTILFCAPGGS